MTPRERAYKIVQNINDIRWPELVEEITVAIEDAIREEKESRKRKRKRGR